MKQESTKRKLSTRALYIWFIILFALAWSIATINQHVIATSSCGADGCADELMLGNILRAVATFLFAASSLSVAAATARYLVFSRKDDPTATPSPEMMVVTQFKFATPMLYAYSIMMMLIHIGAVLFLKSRWGIETCWNGGCEIAYDVATILFPITSVMFVVGAVLFIAATVRYIVFRRKQGQP